METHSTEAWRLTKMRKTIISLNWHKGVSIHGSEPSLLCSMPSSLWASPRTFSLESQLQSKQMPSSHYFHQIQWSSRTTKGEVSIECLSEEVRAKVVELPGTVFHGKYVKNSGITTCPATAMDVCTAWYTVGMTQNHGNRFRASGLWRLEALVNFVQSRFARRIFPQLLILEVMGPLTYSKKVPLLSICQHFSKENVRFDIPHPLNLHFLSMFCFKEWFLISST